jgi:large subunit ribosomal protein L24
MIVENINMAKRHTKPNPNAGQPGGIIDKEMPVDASNVMLWNADAGKGDRVGFKLLDDGRKVRVFRSSGEVVDAT